MEVNEPTEQKESKGLEDLEQDMEEFKEFSNRISRKLQPIQKPLVYVGVTFLLLLVFFMGYGLGGNSVCLAHAGVLDRSFDCHIGVLNITRERVLPSADQFLFKINIT